MYYLYIALFVLRLEIFHFLRLRFFCWRFTLSTTANAGEFVINFPLKSILCFCDLRTSVELNKES